MGDGLERGFVGGAVVGVAAGRGDVVVGGGRPGTALQLGNRDVLGLRGERRGERGRVAAEARRRNRRGRDDRVGGIHGHGVGMGGVGRARGSRRARRMVGGPTVTRRASGVGMPALVGVADRTDGVAVIAVVVHQ